MRYISWLLFVFALLAMPAGAQEPPAAGQELRYDESGISAVAQPTYSLDAPPKPTRLDFDFRQDESRAWVNGLGDFQVSGWIKHRGLLCGTYQMGVRFGTGAPGCQNVTWVTDPLYVSSHLQCNGARMSHMGGDNLAELAAQLERLTCAQRVVRCTGNCR